MYKQIPIFLQVRRITIRDVEFFVKDLFMGRRGQVYPYMEITYLRIPRVNPDNEQHIIYVYRYRYR